MIEVIEFDPKHLDLIDVDMNTGDICPFSKEDWNDRIIQVTKGNITKSVIDSSTSKIICICGCVYLWNGVAECWIVFDKSIKSPKLMLQISRELLYSHIVEHSIHRMQATCRVDFVQGANFLEHLGFKLESLMHQYGADKADYYMYTINIEEN